MAIDDCAPAFAGKGNLVSAKKFWPQDLLFGLLPLLIAFEVLLWTVSLLPGTRGLADFRQLYTGGYMLRTGHDSELYDYDAQQRFEETLVPVGARFPLPINHLAFEELLFAPLSLLSYRTAYLVFMALNGMLLVITVWLVSSILKASSERGKWLPTVLVLAFCPVARALLQGQDSIIMLTLLAGALWSLHREREFLAGLLVGIGVFKFQVTVPIALLYLLWRRWRFVSGFAASSVAAGLVSLWLVGLSGAREYVHLLTSMSVRLTTQADMVRYGTDPRKMLNLRGLISAIFESKLPLTDVQLLVAACSIAVLLACAKQRPSLPLAITASSLVSYHLIVHDASILVIVLAAALCSGSVWSGALAVWVMVASVTAIIHPFAYLTVIPLLLLFISMLPLPPTHLVDSGLAWAGIASDARD